MPRKKKNEVVVETREATGQAPIIRKDKDGNVIGSAYRDFLFSLESGQGNDAVSIETDFLESGRLFTANLSLSHHCQSGD